MKRDMLKELREGAQLTRGETIVVDTVENGWGRLAGGGYVCMEYLEPTGE